MSRKPAEEAPSQTTVGPLTQLYSARAYLEESKIPDMFRSLLAGLMIQRPSEPYRYLDSKLEELKVRGMENVDWESFVYDLHPSRDPLHCKLVKDGKSTEKNSELPPFVDYEPKLFQLTEPTN
ncbi:hypothetical protein LSH36_1001g00024 [Paralvinella palmiformis]|uniref:Uncharacterized protein n=1 Tax=Paralvinella palmiformis TaxID=53620 RepID=A0AAD9IW70_9ANNE|nr:hypothetical protein LSH36_1001g00024 [Paralvinella palmiformis]